MNAGQYILHSLKYLVKLLLLLVVIYFLMYLTGTLGISKAELLGSRGVILLVSVVVLAAAYPSFGFVRRTVAADYLTDRELIRKAFVENGYALSSEYSDHLVFRASSIGKRLWTLWDDTLTVCPLPTGGIKVEGLRKEAVQVVFRIESYTKYR
ncbi:MAG: hypothetical protein SOZ00_05420 [Tidjanibacter sp.]|nr:hypothetical protein [Tidjanibacter sp.]